jgi:hypothetical protein
MANPADALLHYPTKGAYMTKRPENLFSPPLAPSTFPFLAVGIGTIVDVDPTGTLLLDFPGSNAEPVAARTASSLTDLSAKTDLVGHQVVVAFENNDPLLPVIIGRISPLSDEPCSWASASVTTAAPEDLTIDRKTIRFNATQQVVFNCGKASITLSESGKVILRGEYVLSHAYCENRIRGGSVAIN